MNSAMFCWITDNICEYYFFILHWWDQYRQVYVTVHLRRTIRRPFREVILRRLFQINMTLIDFRRAFLRYRYRFMTLWWIWYLVLRAFTTYRYFLKVKLRKIFKPEDDENNTYSVEENCLSCIESCVASTREIWKYFLCILIFFFL